MTVEIVTSQEFETYFIVHFNRDTQCRDSIAIWTQVSDALLSNRGS